jgi:hypothetical protein
LDVRILGGAVRSNSLPTGHIDLNHHHPGLKEDLLEGVMFTKVPSAPFEPEVIKDKTMEDVEGLYGVGEVTGVVREEPGRVILALQDSFSEKHERPGGG